MLSMKPTCESVSNVPGDGLTYVGEKKERGLGTIGDRRKSRKRNTEEAQT